MRKLFGCFQRNRARSYGKKLIFQGDLENWMGNLPVELRTVSIIHLAIPGTHDSFTKEITKHSKIAPDFAIDHSNIKFLGPLLPWVMSKWCKTQEYSVLEQLTHGIRYFDLRIATKIGSNKFFFVHGLYSIDVEMVFNEIEGFLETHPKEVVILDCQHFYKLRQEDHEALMQLLTDTFGHKMLPYASHMDHLSLEYLTSQFRYQVITIYRSDAARFGQPLLWPSDNFPTPWYDTDSMSSLIYNLDDGIGKRDSNKGYISQCVLTPSFLFIARFCLSSLKKKCAEDFQEERIAWLMDQTPGEQGVNIVIGDFVELEQCEFSRLVIGLNDKLLKNVSLELTPVDK